MDGPQEPSGAEREEIEAEFQEELAALKAEQKQVLEEYRLAIEAKRIEKLKAKLNGHSKLL